MSIRISKLQGLLGITAIPHRHRQAVRQPALVDLISNLLDELTRLFHLGLGIRDSAAEMHDAHTALAQAIRERDSDRAEQIVRNEIEMSKNRVLEALTGRNNPLHIG